MKDHKYKINKATIQNEMASRNFLDQVMKFREKFALRADKKVKEILLGNQKINIMQLESTTSRIYQTGYGVELMWSDILGQKVYEGFLYSHLPSIKSENH